MGAGIARLTMLKRLDPEELQSHQFDAYAEHFQQPNVIAVIAKAAMETTAWMRLNKGRIEADGTPVERPWFNEEANAAALPRRMAERARHHALDAAAYEHGLAKYLELAGEYGALDYGASDVAALVFLRSAEVEGWFHLLNRYAWPDPTILMNLDHFAETGDGHPDTPAAHSKKKLAKLARFGFAIVSKPQRAFDIKVGPVAKTFYEEVWFPITEEFKTKIAIWKEEEGK